MSDPAKIEESVNMHLDLTLAFYKKKSNWAEEEVKRLQTEIEDLDDETYFIEKEIKDVSKKLEDFELLEFLDDDRPSDKVRKDIDELDIKLENIDNYLNKEQYIIGNERQKKNLNKDNLIQHEVSKKNTQAFHQLRGDMHLLEKTLRKMGLKD